MNTTSYKFDEESHQKQPYEVRYDDTLLMLSVIRFRVSMLWRKTSQLLAWGDCEVTTMALEEDK